MLAQLLIVAGALVFGLLGAVHLAYTFFTNKLDAREASTTAAMKATSLVLTRRTSLWKAWIGFNASHSLGILLFAAIYLLLAIGHMPWLRQSLALVWLPVFAGASYLVLARLYWFRTPLIGVGIATTCFVVAALILTA
jgi:hypothetical protein